ncbi:MAG: hypothetical protein A2172_05365 [Candidatus Woykebacteria bacterium RBG_13_40_15]|uniref:Uncharacterized protein n=1 Tax=Candidatus Woykebacteria bacterium RBG_13_40_15 TaxID=1802593 RepID=A0A1G1W827_9BACT|nr:MAG: hypothetical protein A2172_05365 [Candidatus Woykebacteria bacterium RBG_13_40_15]
MITKLNVKLLLIVGFLIIATGVFFAGTKFKTSLGKSDIGSVTPEATKSAEITKEDPKKDESKEEVKGTTAKSIPTSTVQQSSSQTVSTDESGKITALDDLLQKMGNNAIKIKYEKDKWTILYDKWNEEAEGCKSLSTPELQLSCVQTAESIYKPALQAITNNINSLTATYRQWESQALQIIASCSEVCAGMYDGYKQALSNQGIPLP